jgi:hypothetical protein
MSGISWELQSMTKLLLDGENNPNDNGFLCYMLDDALDYQVLVKKSSLLDALAPATTHISALGRKTQRRN